MKRLAFAMALMMTLQSCAERGHVTTGTDPAGVVHHEPIPVATSRGSDPVTGR